MPVWRTRTEDVTARLAPAAAPPYSPTPYSVHGGLVRFAGAPGTVEELSPAPPSTHTRSMNPRDKRPSDCSPNHWLPRMGVPFADNMTPPVPWRPPNELPIPAGNWLRLPQIASRTPPRIGGRGVVPQPRQFTRWPSFLRAIASDG
jgi:hypothetical protein